MADSRNHDHYVFQDLDLLGNKIKGVRDISSDDDLNLTSGNSKKVIVNSDLNTKGNVSITDSSKRLTVSGKSEFKEDVVIDSGHTLTISGVTIQWDSTSNSLLFINNNTNNS